MLISTVPAYLQLSSGHVFPGYSFGAPVSTTGEAVFQTGMVGYPEALTDPSYASQILVLTYPLIGNYGVPDMSITDDTGIPLHAESSKIHTAALVVCSYTHNFSHWNAAQSLQQWLCSENVPAITDVDTRHLTMVIRESGTLLSRLVIGAPSGQPELPLVDPNLSNLVAQVSTKNIRHIPGLQASKPDAPRILVVDCGVKNNQLRALLQRAASLTVVPWDAHLESFDTPENCDAIFVTNGPGDPAVAAMTVDALRAAMSRRTDRPIFGICLGHQLLARAAGYGTFKLKYGNRGHNQPCEELTTGRCYITSQNHGFAVNTDSVNAPSDWFQTYINANDGTNEGISHKRLPFFSVQFHPEGFAGPHDTEFLFDVFADAAARTKKGEKVNALFDYDAAAKRTRDRAAKLSLPEASRFQHSIRKVIVLGSGGLSIGQAGEFDYSGSQCIKALKSQNVRTVLINPNIATVQTSPGLADKVYYLPVTPENVIKVAENERPDGLLMTFGGQTALNCGVELYRSGELDRLSIKVLGTPVEAILDTEDRERFNARLSEIGEPFADSKACKTIEDCLRFAAEIGYPVIIRAAFALGGLGSGFANNEDDLFALASRAFTTSSQVLVERSMKGWKEVEYEVVRDAHDNCITVCNMENFDPLGIHTGDSIVVAPSQTLNDSEYHMLRDAAIRTVRHLGVVGECNIQYALNSESMQYCVIEVNARLSRSSALASKATGYPLAFVAAHLALGIPLPEIRNSITEVTCACFEPSLDYLVVKVPRWDLKKFTRVCRSLGSSMKSVGEVMSIGRTFEEALQKALRMVCDYSVHGFESNIVEYSIEAMSTPTDERLLAIADGLAKGVSVDEIHDLTKIDKWFLRGLERISKFETLLKSESRLLNDELVYAKELGFSDRQIAKLVDETELAVREQRVRNGIRPCVKQIDTVAAEFPARTNYLYVTYACSKSLLMRSGSLFASLSSLPSTLLEKVIQNDDVLFNEHGTIVLGCGAYRIGSSVEFDCCAVSATRTLRSQGMRSVMINYNPETVSTDYDECDRLYFEELSFERVLDIYNAERATGIIVSMGGQIANNIAMSLHRQAARILGTTPEMIDSAENRYKFSRMCDRIGVDQPKWKALSSIDDAKAFCADVTYPVLVRPSYVLSGAAMNVVYRATDLELYLTEAATVSPDFPVVISKFIEQAKEIEVDAIAQKGEVIMHVISEHVENAGVHSGDATLVLPPQDLDEITVSKVEEATVKVAQALNVTGPMNIQFIAKQNEIKVIECNLRASRTFPFVSKTIGLDLAKLATKVMLGKPVQRYPVEVNQISFVGVKVAQFSFSRLLGADPILGVEMASTGEVACFGSTREEAYMKGLIATSKRLPTKTVGISIGSYSDKLEFLPSAKRLHELGMTLVATPGTADFFRTHGVNASETLWTGNKEYAASEVEHTIENMLRDGRIEFLINIPSENRHRRLPSFISRGYNSRRAAVDFNVPLLTNIKCAKLFVKVLDFIHKEGRSLPLRPYDSRFSARVITLPGLILLNTAVDLPTARKSFSAKTKKARTFVSVSRDALEGGFAFIGIKGEPEGWRSPEQYLAAVKEAEEHSFCDFSLFVTGRPDNASMIRSVAGRAAGLSIHPTRKDLQTSDGIDSWIEHFNTWPTGSLIVVQSSRSTLAALLFAAVVTSRHVHVIEVNRKEDMELIRASKNRGLQVSCDVNILDLYATGASGRIQQTDQEALWENLDTIDTIRGPPTIILPLLLQSVFDGRITLDWVRSRLYDVPSQILGLSPGIYDSTAIEVDINETWSSTAYSDIEGVQCRGLVRRVVCNDQIAFLDGKVWANRGSGNNIIADPLTFQESLNSSSSSKTAVTSPRRNFKPGGKGSGITYEPIQSDLDTPDVVKKAKPVGQISQSGGKTLQWEGITGIPPRSPLISLVSKSPELQQARNTVGDFHSIERIDLPEAIHNGKQKRTHRLFTTADTLPGYGNSWWSGRHILSVSQFTRGELHKLFEVAQEMKTMVSRVGQYDLLRGKVMASLFYEPSTRTSCSFQAAMQRLGGTVLNVQNTGGSSVVKGESVADTVRTLECYTDIIVMRHPAVGAPQEAASFARHPIINAGDGVGEHPTQALLDVFTIREELGTVNGITVTFVGDLKNGRTVHSLARVLALYSVRLRYIAPDSLKMPPEVLEELASRDVEQVEHSRLKSSVIRETDVLYVTRVQKERFKDVQEYNAVKDAYAITPKTLTRAKEHMIVMHPLPRVAEISTDVDSDPRAVYFRQMEHGIYVRMALLAMVLGKR